MNMETMLRYIVGIAIVYGIGREIYQSIRSRSDYFQWAIVALMSVVFGASREYLIISRLYDFAMIAVGLLTSGCFVISQKSKFGKYLKSITVGSLFIFLAFFVYWNIKAKSITPTILTTPLRGFTTHRIDEVYFRYNGKPFGRSCNLNEYQDVEQLTEQYDVKLTVKSISVNVTKLESITLIPKFKK